MSIMASKGKSEKAENPSFTLFLKSVKRFESVPSIAAIVQDIFNIEVEQQQVQWFWSELQSTLLDAGHPKPDLVAVHAAVPDLQHLLVPSQGGGKRLKDGRFQTVSI